MKRVLVTGGTGFLGGALLRALVQSGCYQVRALVRRPDGVAAEELPPEVELVQGDVLDLQSLIRACDGCVGVFHVAAFVKSWSPDSSRFFEVNVGGLKNVIEAVKCTESVMKLVYTSSFFALGPTPNGHIGDEHQVHSGKGFCTEYERSKYESDILARSAAEEGVPMVLLYPGVIYGSGKITRGNVIADILIERFNGRLPGYVGSGNDRFSFSHVEDVATGHVQAFEKGATGQRYLLAGENASLVDVFNIAASLTCTKRPWFHIPMFLVCWYGYVSVVFARLTGTEPVISHPAAAVIKHQWAYSSAKAEKELDYKPRSLKEGLAEMLVFLRDKGLIKVEGFPVSGMKAMEQQKCSRCNETRAKYVSSVAGASFEAQTLDQAPSPPLMQHCKHMFCRPCIVRLGFHYWSRAVLPWIHCQCKAALSSSAAKTSEALQGCLL